MAKLDKDALRVVASVDKTVYAPGEPVVVRFSWANLTDAEMQILDWPGPSEGITELKRNYDDVLYDFVIRQHDGSLLEYKGPVACGTPAFFRHVPGQVASRRLFSCGPPSFL